MPLMKFHIHADNIVECDRIITLIEKALADDGVSSVGPYGSAACPVYKFELENNFAMEFTCYPGFGRWNQDFMDVIISSGGILREAPDVLLSRVEGTSEKLLAAMEFSAALSAGNQAWQRHGRAYSFGLAKIPYLYITEIGGYELDTNRKRKSPRTPNPLALFAYLTFSIKGNSPVFPVFIPSPGASKEALSKYGNAFGEPDLLRLIRALLLGQATEQHYNAISDKVLGFVLDIAKSSKRKDTLVAAQWQDAYDALSKGKSLVERLIVQPKISWAKRTTQRNLTDSVNQLMDITSNYATGFTAHDLPLCIIAPANRHKFTSDILSLYPDLATDFRNWLNRDKPLTICWIRGFKPRGDDSRPDRGLPIMTRMLIGDAQDLLTVVYGPAKANVWEELQNEPNSLSQRNGLWKSIMSVSDAILVDSATDQAAVRGFLKTHWENSDK